MCCSLESGILYLSSVIAADLNNDGFTDLVTANRYSSEVSVRINDGDGTFDGPCNGYPVVGQPYSVYAADFDGDSDLDLVTANMSTDNISVLLNEISGGGGFENHIDYSVGDAPVWVTSSDINNDGLLDLITANSLSDNISILTSGIWQPAPTLISPLNNYRSTLHDITLDWIGFEGWHFIIEVDDDGVFGAGAGTQTYDAVESEYRLLAPFRRRCVLSLREFVTAVAGLSGQIRP